MKEIKNTEDEPSGLVNLTFVGSCRVVNNNPIGLVDISKNFIGSMKGSLKQNLLEPAYIRGGLK